MKLKLDKFLKEWNENRNNRDKTVTTLEEMKETKEKI